MHPNRRLSIGLFCFFQGLYLLLASGRVRTTDEHSAHFMTESLWLEGSTAVPQMVQVGRFYGRTGLDGEPYPPYGPGQSLLAIPYYAVIGSALSAGMPAQAALLAREAATSLLSTTAAAGCVLALFHLALAIGAGARAAAATAAILGLATPLATYATQGFAEPLLCLLVAGALLAFVRALKGPSAVRALAIASALAGYAFLTRPFPATTLIVALGVGYLVERRTRATFPELLALALPFGLAAAAYLLLNFLRFGSATQFGYPEHVELGRLVDTFDNPIWIGLYGLLLSPGKGLFIFAPPVLIGLAGLARLARIRPGLAAALVTQACMTILFFARYSSWEGGYCFGPRYLLPLLPALLAPLALIAERANRLVLAAIVALSLAGGAIEIVGTSTSYLEDQVGPGATYYGERYHYRIDYTLRGQTELLKRYSASLFTDRALQEPLGVGLDFWWVFLAKTHCKAMVLVTWASASAALLVAGSLLTLRALRQPQSPSA